MSRRGNPGITIRLTQDQIDRLKAIATQRGQSLSDLVRDAIQLLLLIDKK